VRVHGYDEVPIKSPSGVIARVGDPEGRVDTDAVRRVLTARGYSEALDFSFVANELLKTWQMDGGAVALANPLSAELGVMRTSLLPGLVEALKRNAARQQSRVRLFEIGTTFHSTGPVPLETNRLAAVATGSAAAEQWGVVRRAVDFYDVKGDVEQLLALGGAHVEGGCFDAVDLPYLHPGRSAAVRRGERRIGVVGNLHPRLAKALDVDPETYVFEIDLDPLTERAVPRAGELSRYPSIRRDIAVVVDRSVPYAHLATAVRKAVGARLRDLVLFDEFVGKGLPDGARSLAIGLILQDDSRTLTDLDADESVRSAVDTLAREFGAELRS
jgi:phenylalanyl-tRNA synthetase beta chain